MSESVSKSKLGRTETTDILKVQKIRNRGRVWRFRGQAFVDGTLVAEAEVSAVIVET
jgi:3-hydroxymyristoyl/3-hydroxydecanoyl-(acyl carrier protein) dehydratase